MPMKSCLLTPVVIRPWVSMVSERDKLRAFRKHGIALEGNLSMFEIVN